MKRVLMRKISGLLFLMIGVWNFAQQGPPAPPPNPEAGGIGHGSATPIDMYTTGLFLVAVMIMIYYVYRKRNLLLK